MIFGTGYSSLSTLQAIPFDKIKIDRSFIANLDRNVQSATIVRAVLALGRGLNLPVVAEGVETQAQLAFLSHEDFAEVQGYLLGRPLPIEDYAGVSGTPSCSSRLLQTSRSSRAFPDQRRRFIGQAASAIRWVSGSRV